MLYGSDSVSKRGRVVERASAETLRVVVPGLMAEMTDFNEDLVRNFWKKAQGACSKFQIQAPVC